VDSRRREIKPVVRKFRLSEHDEVGQNLEYWLSRPPEERVAEVERLREVFFEPGDHVFERLLESFNEGQVEFVVIGAFALAFHGAPRCTHDLDVYVRPTRSNARRMMNALERLGLASPDLCPTDFEEPDNIVQLGIEPNRIDLVTSMTGVSWEDVQAGKVAGLLGGVAVDYIGRNEFVTNKEAAGRPKDLADVDAIRKR